MEALGPDSTFLMWAKSLLRRQCWSFRLVVGGPGAPPTPPSQHHCPPGRTRDAVTKPRMLSPAQKPLSNRLE